MKTQHRSLATAALVALAAAVSTLPMASPALASGMTGRDITVRYGDLAVDTVDGATQLLRRIEVAAGRVCAPLYHGDLASRGRRDACEQKLTSAAVSNVNSPVLVSVYQSGRRDPPRVIAQTR